MAIASQAEDVKDSSKNFKDIFHVLVDYQNFKIYLNSIFNVSQEMERQKVVRVLKDPSTNFCSLLCCCRNQFPVNQDDENVIQTSI
jgi:hypothetical protein